MDVAGRLSGRLGSALLGILTAAPTTINAAAVAASTNHREPLR
jgi:hypothetical protein